jgi:hypothetical protein
MTAPKDVVHTSRFLDRLSSILGSVELADQAIWQVDLQIARLHLGRGVTTLLVRTRKGILLALDLWTTDHVVVFESVSKVTMVIESEQQEAFC